MGACLSSQPQPPPASAAGSPDSGGLTSLSKRWLERKKKKKLKNEGERGGEGEDSEELYRVTGRMFANGASEVACLFTQQGKKGTNQDAMIVWEVKTKEK